MPSLALDLGLGKGFFVRSSPFVPNYPSGLSYTTGLLGWYDSSQTSSIVKDGSNNISQWQNLFNGATQGATVLPAFTIPAGNSSPTYVTGKSYITGVNSGSKTGVYFDGISSLLSISGLGALTSNLKNYAIFAVVKNYSVDTSLAITGSKIALIDSQNNNYQTYGLEVGYNPTNSTYLTLYGSGINTSQGGSIPGFSYGFNAVSSGSVGTVYLFYEASGSSSLQTWSDLSGQYPDYPWDQISLGGNIGAGDYQQSLIGEILVFNMTAAQQGSGGANVKSIFSYFQNKWQ
jgi:hypothetical protein